MRIDHYHHFNDGRLDRIESLLRLILKKEHQIMAREQELLDAVQAEDTLIDGVATMFDTLRKDLKDALAAAGASPAAQQAIDTAIDKQKAQTAKLAKALSTTSDGQPVPPTDTPPNIGPA